MENEDLCEMEVTDPEINELFEPTQTQEEGENDYVAFDALLSTGIIV